VSGAVFCRFGKLPAPSEIGKIINCRDNLIDYSPDCRFRFSFSAAWKVIGFENASPFDKPAKATPNRSFRYKRQTLEFIFLRQVIVKRSELTFWLALFANPFFFLFDVNLTAVAFENNDD
jgi:hypothetical protein